MCKSYIDIMYAESDRCMWMCHFSTNQPVFRGGGESRMKESRMKVNRIATAVLGLQMVLGLTAVPAQAAGKSQTLTGEVSDAMCGAKHEMPGKPADCTRACMKHGSKYALVVGDKVYTLETSDKAALDKLDNLAGAKAKVTGEVDGTTIAVKSVAAGS
jgi:hypothetical protein